MRLDLYSRSGSILVSNVIFEDCTGEGNVVSIERICDENLTQDTIRFRHVEFTNNGLSSDGCRILFVYRSSSNFPKVFGVRSLLLSIIVESFTLYLKHISGGTIVTSTPIAQANNTERK